MFELIGPGGPMPGSLAGAFAAYVGPQKKPVIDRYLLTEIGDVAVIENQACARKVALAAAIWDSCVHQTVQIGEHITDAGNYAASETAKILGCSKTVADTLAEIGMDLRLRLPAVKAAFEAGELDLARVRAIYRATASYSVGPVERAETEILTAARRLSPGPLATETDAIMQRTAPQEAAALRKDLARLATVRYRDKDMIATIEADLEAGDAAACWQLINEMAATLCPRDPRTRGQRRAAAYTALMHRETYIACTCAPDDDHPCTANPELPDRRTPLTTVTIDLATLLQLADLPAYLAGHGDIDADYARELAENSDLQILLTDALDLARELGYITGNTAENANATATDTEGTEGTEEPAGAASTSGTPAATHMTFHPLGRGRRRRGMRLPKQTLSKTRKNIDAPFGPHAGRYTLVESLERAIEANPALAVALYPDGHGGFIEPPAGALRYRPGLHLIECVRQRDRTCRHPGCDVPAANCEIDHVIPFDHRNAARGGWSILTNLHCLCKYHHSLKTMGAWTPTMLAGAVDYWRSSSGTTAVTVPGNTIGTTDHADRSLIPHVPRKRRPAHATEPAATVPAATATAAAAAAAPAAPSPHTEPRSSSATTKYPADAAQPIDGSDDAADSDAASSDAAGPDAVDPNAADSSATDLDETPGKRRRVFIAPLVECDQSLGTSIGLTVGTAMFRHTGGAPF